MSSTAKYVAEGQLAMHVPRPRTGELTALHQLYLDPPGDAEYSNQYSNQWRRHEHSGDDVSVKPCPRGGLRRQDQP